jgi:uncharacterized membrane protein YccF (DUF307 family)
LRDFKNIKFGEKMKLIGNIIWFILFGMIPCAIHFVLGAILCCTFVCFPAGMALFKIAKLEAFPFGKTTELRAEEPSIANILWVALIGSSISIVYLLLALILCATIILIPFAKQCVKIAKLAHVPFGSEVYHTDMLRQSNHNSNI